MQVYLDINVDREPRGRITVELFPDVPVGAQRFVDLARGVGGVGYSLAAKIDGVSPVGILKPYALRSHGSTLHTGANCGCMPIAFILQALACHVR